MSMQGAAAWVLAGVIFTSAAVWAATQGQQGTANTQAQPHNLKVLPKEMSGEDLDKLMHVYQQSLGVPCGYCHEQDPETKAMDYASDQNPAKETARLMITMTRDINSKYLAQLSDQRYADPVTCGSCHRGQVQPPPFEWKATQ